MGKLKINVYDDKNKVIKTAEAQLVELKFKTIRSLMDILKIDDINDTMGLLRVIAEAWDEVKGILTKIFPDLTEEELDNVKLNELVPVFLQIIKYSFAEIITIPSDSKN